MAVVFTSILFYLFVYSFLHLHTSARQGENMDAFFYILAVLTQVFLAMVRIFCNVDCGASWEGLRMQKVQD